MPAKTKARDVVPGWPRGKSTGESMWCFGWYSTFSFRTSKQPAGDAFRRTTEEALESSYRAGQQAMADDYRARYRTLTEEDKAWLRYPGDEPLREAMKEAFYQQIRATPENVPLGILLAIKEAASSKSFLLRFR